MTKKILILLPVLLTVTAFSQREHHTGISAGFGNTNSVTADIVKNFKLLKSEKLHIGVGARTGIIFTSNNISYTTAPAKHTKESSGIDTFVVSKPWSIPVNINFNLAWFFSKKISAGFNIDLVGFTFGSKKNAELFPSAKLQETKGERTVLTEQNAKPMVNNFNMFGDYRKGTTLNELFIRYQVQERFSVKASYMIITSEFISENRIGNNSNYRFRNTSTQISIGLRYHFI